MDRVLDIRPFEWLGPSASTEAALDGVQEGYMNMREVESILVTRRQWEAITEAYSGEWYGPPNQTARLWGVPVEVLGRFPYLLGGDAHGYPVPEGAGPTLRVASFARDPLDYSYVRAVYHPGGDESIEFWYHAPLGQIEATNLLARELVRAASRMTAES